MVFDIWQIFGIAIHKPIKNVSMYDQSLISLLKVKTDVEITKLVLILNYINSIQVVFSDTIIDSSRKSQDATTAISPKSPESKNKPE